MVYKKILFMIVSITLLYGCDFHPDNGTGIDGVVRMDGKKYKYNKEKIEDFKSNGGKGSSCLYWNLGNRQAEEAKASRGKAGFSNYMKQFSGTEKINKGKTVADVTAQIKQQMGRFRTARA